MKKKKEQNLVNLIFLHFALIFKIEKWPGLIETNI